jgi:hypothetical protein
MPTILDPGTIRARVAANDAPSVGELALELAKARAAGAEHGTVAYLVQCFQVTGGAKAMDESAIETWLDAALPILADRESSQALDIWRQFVLWVLTDPAAGVAQFCEPASEQLAAVERVANLFRREVNGEKINEADWSESESAARAAWSAAWSESAESAAESAWSAAESAWSAAESAWSAARAAWSAAAAAAAAESAESAAAAARASRAAARKAQAHKLAELLIA